MLIRRIRADDAALLKKIRLEALANSPEAFSASLADAQQFSDEKWLEERTLPHATGSTWATFLALSPTGSCVGMVCAVPGDAPQVAELVSMYTAPEARGMGVGKALVVALQQWTQDTQYTSMRLWVMQDNSSAQRLYERCGFQVADSATHGQANDPCADEVRMVWYLPN